MNIALVGASGQLGRDLAPALASLGRVTPLGREQLELTDAESMLRALGELKPALVVNTAAYNLVDRAEDEPEAAFAVNSFGVLQLARACQKLGAALVHFSTDYVFGLNENRRQPYREDDLPGPLSVYGASKLAGEDLVRMVSLKHFIVRSCGLYGSREQRGSATGDQKPASTAQSSATQASAKPQFTIRDPQSAAAKPPSPGKPSNFVQTMLRLGRERGEVRVVSDQVCTPTSTADLAAATARLIETGAYGTYHLTSAGQCSWHEFAGEIFRIARKIGLLERDVVLHSIPSTEFTAQARRPAYSVLSCDKYAKLGLPPMRHWNEALAEYLTGFHRPDSR